MHFRVSLYRTSDHSIGNQFYLNRKFVLVRVARFTLYIRREG
jgi:hypothetical protein